MNQQAQRSTVGSQRSRVMGVRYALLVLGGISLIVGMNFGLILLGFEAPLVGNNLELLHAQLMVFGFLGTLISLERAVAVRKPWAFIAPVGFGLGAILLLTDLPQQVGEALQLIGSLGLVECYRLAWKRVPSTALSVQILGAVLAVGAACLWLGGTATELIVPWLCGFIVLTIVGERLDLARLNIGSPRAESWALSFAVATAVGAAGSLLWHTVGLVIFGCSLLALVGWLLRYDIAMKTIRSSGLPRYTAACLLSGYIWLAFAGVMWVAIDPDSSAGLYDLTIHAVFIGFALSMVLGHAPIILPAVLGRPLPYRAVMWIPLIILQASLILRVFVGDLRSITWAWQVGGATNVFAMMLFLVVAVGSVVLGAQADGLGSHSKYERDSVVPTGSVGAPTLLPLVGKDPDRESQTERGSHD